MKVVRQIRIIPPTFMLDDDTEYFFIKLVSERSKIKGQGYGCYSYEFI